MLLKLFLFSVSFFNHRIITMLIYCYYSQISKGGCTVGINMGCGSLN